DKPEHEETVPPFYIDKYEVTNEQYNEFLKANPGHRAPETWPNGIFPKDKARYPVTGITYLEAQEYARFVQKRLPNEAEWEYAARGADKRLYPWGNEFNTIRTNVKESGTNSLVNVDRFGLDKSPFEVYDMGGNAAEWTLSTYQPYRDSAAKPLPDRVVVRGGSYLLDDKQAMVTHRLIAKPDLRRPDVGFRCVRRAINP